MTLCDYRKGKLGEKLFIVLDLSQQGHNFMFL